MQAVEGAPGRVHTCTCGTLSLIHRTPFQQLHIVEPEMLAKIALLEQASGKKVSRSMEYGLDIWGNNRKVLNLEWSASDREMNLVSFKRGQWQAQLQEEVSKLRAP